MNKIDEMIRWYEENETRREYKLIKAKLRLIKNLFDEIENSDDRLFMDEIIDNFSAIMELHRDVIIDKEMEIESWEAGSNNGNTNHDFVCLTQQDSFRDDKQLQAAFTAYLSFGKTKPLSSYTINDYCSRLRNLWKSFYTAYQEGSLEYELCVNIQRITTENPLMNAYYHIDELQCYAHRMSMQSEEKRNWANTCAALNKFAEFVRQCR